jgi:hypothetical protein
MEDRFKLVDLFNKATLMVESRTSFYFQTGDLLGLVAVWSEKAGAWFTQGGDWGDPADGPYCDEAVIESIYASVGDFELETQSFMEVWEFEGYDDFHHDRYHAYTMAQEGRFV